MKLSEYTRISKEDHPKMPDWFLPIANNINRNLEQLFTLSARNVSFVDNGHTEFRKLTMKHGSPEVIYLQLLKRTPIGVLVLETGGGEVSGFDWEPGAQPRTIVVTVTWTTIPATNPSVTLLVVGS